LRNHDEISVQFVYIPDEEIYGRVVDSNNYYTVVEYERVGIIHREMFEDEDLIYLDEITIPIYKEEETE